MYLGDPSATEFPSAPTPSPSQTQPGLAWPPSLTQASEPSAPSSNGENLGKL